MNRVNLIPETRIDMDGRNDEKQKILPKSTCKKEKAGRKKMRLEFEKTAALLAGEKHVDQANKDHIAIPMDDDSSQEESRPKFFGVKNYLHNFYEAVAIKNPQLYEDIPDDSVAANPPFKDNKSCRSCWKFGIGAGLLIVGIGLILILIGFVTPLHSNVADKTEDFLVLDKSATTFNEYMRICRLVGVGMFIIGFSLFLAIVLLALCWNIDDGNGDIDDDDSDSFCMTLTAEGTLKNIKKSTKIPGTEGLAAVQPKREKADVVMTKSGLCAPVDMQTNLDN